VSWLILNGELQGMLCGTGCCTPHRSLHIYRADVRQQWDNLRRHDVGFLLTVRPRHEHIEDMDLKLPFAERVCA